MLRADPDGGPDGRRRSRAERYCAAPLFFLLPRLHSPFAVAPFRVDDALSTRAHLGPRGPARPFGAAKRSDRVILRIVSSAALDSRSDELRLREAVFTDYLDGVWIRDPAGRGRGAATASAHRAGAPAGAPRPWCPST